MIILRMLLGRILSLVPLVIGVTLFVFVVMLFSPVDQAVAALGDTNPSAAQLEQFRRDNGLLDPWPVQYGRFVWQLLHGNFGNSVINKE